MNNPTRTTFFRRQSAEKAINQTLRCNATSIPLVLRIGTDDRTVLALAPYRRTLSTLLRVPLCALAAWPTSRMRGQLSQRS